MKKTTTQTFDDLDGTVIEPGDGRTIVFAFDGQTYSIDLTKTNEDRLRLALDPFVSAAQPVRGSGKTSRTSAGNAHLMRIWAREHGIDVPDRGRIPAPVREAFEAAN